MFGITKFLAREMSVVNQARGMKLTPGQPHVSDNIFTNLHRSTDSIRPLLVTFAKLPRENCSYFNGYNPIDLRLVQSHSRSKNPDMDLKTLATKLNKEAHKCKDIENGNRRIKHGQIFNADQYAMYKYIAALALGSAKNGSIMAKIKLCLLSGVIKHKIAAQVADSYKLPIVRRSSEFG